MKKFASEQGLPVLLCSAIITSALSIYTPLVPLASLAVILLNSAFFALWRYVHSRKSGNALFFIFSVTLLYAFNALVLSAGGISTEALYSSLFGSMPPFHQMILTFDSCFVFSAVLYYATSVQPRIYIVFLTAVMPFLLYVKRDTVVPSIYIAVTIMLFFAVVVHLRKQQFSKNAKLIGGRVYRRSLSVFMAILFLTAFVVPKAEDESPFNLLDKVSVGPNVVSFSKLGKFRSTSGGKGLDNIPGDQLLFEVHASDQLYLKTQVFDNYNGQSWSTINTPKYNNGLLTWRSREKALSTKELYEALLKTADSAPDIMGAYGINPMDMGCIAEDVQSATIVHKEFSSTVVQHPLYSFDIVTTPPGNQSYMTLNNDLFLNNSISENGDGYVLSFYNRSITDFEKWNRLTKGLSLQRFMNLLKEALLAPDNINDDVITGFWQEAEQVSSYNDTTETVMSGDIKELALNITRDCLSDYEKALAIEQYFSQNGYIYDLSYTPSPKETGLDHFIFASKTGTCSDYATAMTVLARAANLSARYVEGFLTGKGTNGVYNVTPINSHAYTEVFIPGCGWMVFDATVADNSPNVRSLAMINPQQENTDENLNPIQLNVAQQGFMGFSGIMLDNADIMMYSLLLLIASLLVYYLVKRYLIPPLAESLFRYRVKRLDGRRGTIKIYNRLKTHLEKQLKTNLNSYTSQMTADLVKEKYRFNISLLIKQYNQAAFGCKQISDAEFQKVFYAYSKLYLFLRY